MAEEYKNPEVDEEPVEAREKAPRTTMEAITEEARDLTEKVGSYSKEAKASMSADYKKGGVEALVKNKYFWVALGATLVILVLLGVID